MPPSAFTRSRMPARPNPCWPEPGGRPQPSSSITSIRRSSCCQPWIVTALALVTVTIHYARPVYQTEVTLFLAYLLMFMPRALINLRAGIAQAPVELENVARSLGRSPARALWSITMRLAAPGAAAGAALVFLGVSNELTATLLLSPLGTRTLSTGFWALTSEIDYVAAAPYALLMIVISLPLTAVLYMQSKKMAGL